MQSNPTRICPSPVVACSASRLVHIASSRPVLFRRVGFGPRTDLFCGLSQLCRYRTHETFSSTAKQKIISPPKNKPAQTEGPAAGTCDDEKEGLSEEDEKKSSEFVEGLMSEEEEKKSSELLEDLSDEEKKKIGQFVEGLSEEQKIKISEILGGKREQGKNEFAEGLIREQSGKTGEFLEGLSEEEKRKISKFLEKNFSEIERGKISEYVEGLSEKEKKKIRELVEELTEEGMKKIVRFVVKSEQGKKTLKIVTKGKGKEEDMKKLNEFFRSLNVGEKNKFFKLVEGLSKEKLIKSEEMKKIAEVLWKNYRKYSKGLVDSKKYNKFFNALIEEDMRKICVFVKGDSISRCEFVDDLIKEDKRKISEFMKDVSEETNKKIIMESFRKEENKKISELFSEAEKKKYKEFFDERNMKELLEGFKKEQNKKISEPFEFFSEEVKKKIIENMDGLGVEVRKKVKELKECLRVEGKKIAKLVDVVKKPNDKKTRNKSLDLLSKRSVFATKVFGALEFQVLSGSVAYAAMKMCPPIIAALKEYYFYLFSLLLTGGSFLPTCQAFKDTLSNRKNNDIVSTIALGLLNGAIAAFGVVLADVHLVKSDGLLMVGGLVETFLILLLLIPTAVFEAVRGEEDLSCFGPSKSTFTAAIIASFIRILKPSPFTGAIEAGLIALASSMFVLYDTDKVLKRFDDDEFTEASAHLFWDLYGLFISTIKIFAVQQCVN